jgi:hypothetical protein
VRAHEARFALADFPATAEVLRTGGAYDATADEAEARLLAEIGVSAGLGVGVPLRDGGAWLLEVWGDDRTASLAGAVPALRALAAAAVAPLG